MIGGRPMRRPRRSNEHSFCWSLHWRQCPSIGSKRHRSFFWWHPSQAVAGMGTLIREIARAYSLLMEGERGSMRRVGKRPGCRSPENLIKGDCNRESLLGLGRGLRTRAQSHCGKTALRGLVQSDHKGQNRWGESLRFNRWVPAMDRACTAGKIHYLFSRCPRHLEIQD